MRSSGRWCAARAGFQMQCWNDSVIRFGLSNVHWNEQYYEDLTFAPYTDDMHSTSIERSNEVLDDRSYTGGRDEYGCRDWVDLRKPPGLGEVKQSLSAGDVMADRMTEKSMFQNMWGIPEYGMESLLRSGQKRNLRWLLSLLQTDKSLSADAASKVLMYAS